MNALDDRVVAFRRLHSSGLLRDAEPWDAASSRGHGDCRALDREDSTGDDATARVRSSRRRDGDFLQFQQLLNVDAVFSN